jgi:hypothetical protein
MNLNSQRFNTLSVPQIIVQLRYNVVDFGGGFGPDIFYKEYIKNKFTLVDTILFPYSPLLAVQMIHLDVCDHNVRSSNNAHSNLSWKIMKKNV